MDDAEPRPPTDADRSGEKSGGRRALLTGIGIGGAAVVGAVAGGGTAAAMTGGVQFRRESLTVECALLGDTFRFSSSANPANDADFRVPFLVEGWLYAPGTIPASGFIPVADDAIGRWFCRGWQVIDESRPEPHAVTNQLFVFGEIRADRLFPPDQITSEGIEGTFGDEVATRSICGGAGRYLGATGSIRQTPIGINSTVFADGTGDSAPNLRFDMDLIVVDD